MQALSHARRPALAPCYGFNAAPVTDALEPAGAADSPSRRTPCRSRKDLGTVGHNLRYTRAEPPKFAHIWGHEIPVSFPFGEGDPSHA